MSQTELARACGVNRSAICRLESRREDSLRMYRRIGRALGIDFRTLIPEDTGEGLES